MNIICVNIADSKSNLYEKLVSKAKNRSDRRVLEIHLGNLRWQATIKI